MDNNSIEKYIKYITVKYSHQKEFISAVSEELRSLEPFFIKNPKYLSGVPYLIEPETLYQFKVQWEDDNGNIQQNNGFRCHYSNVLGPYKGGLRFSHSVNPSIMKFLAFEQTFKNSLVGIPLGGAKGGSDFDPKGKSKSEIIRFCKSFAQSLNRLNILSIDGRRDIPAGDIGVSSFELGIIFGEIRRLTGDLYYNSLTGKPHILGGSILRPEATGYGLVYILEEALKIMEKLNIESVNAFITGSGNVAIHCAEMLLEKNGKVFSLSDSGSSIFKIQKDSFTKIEEGNKKNKMLNGELLSFNKEEISTIKKMKFVNKKRCNEIVKILNEETKKKKEKIEFLSLEGKKVWEIFKHINSTAKSPINTFLPCATQHEVGLDGAKVLYENGVRFIAEGANMPSDNDASDFFNKNCKIFIPSKAANAGGVSVSGLEMIQNNSFKSWSAEKVEKKLIDIMKGIFRKIHSTAKELGDERNLRLGANAYAFKRVVDALVEDGSIKMNK